MSINDILGSALSGLHAAQAGLRTVAGNVANVDTPGYSRQVVNQASSVTGGVVTGVAAGEPTRIASAFLETAVFTREGDVGSAEVRSSYLDQLQSLLGSSDAAGGIAAQFDGLVSAAVALTATQAPGEQAGAFVARTQSAIASLQQLDADARALAGDVDGEIGATLDRVNALLRQVHGLNAAIVGQRAAGEAAAGATDQRAALIGELGGLAKIVVRTQQDGRVSIETSSGLTLLDRKLRQLSYPAPSGGTAQPDYPPITIRFAGDGGADGAATGETIASGAVGGKLGGLIDLRDRALPRFGDQLGTLFGELAARLNAASNASSAVPPPATLAGGQSGLIAGDRLGFGGAATFAVVASDGRLIARTSVDFAAMGAGATIQDAVDAINGGLGSAAVARFAGGRLSITAVAPGSGIVVAQDAAAPSDRAGAGFAQFFGLDDLVQSEAGTLTPPGFVGSDPTGFASDQTAALVLRDAGGRMLGRAIVTGATGQTFADLVAGLNGGPLGAFGSFSLDTSGRIRFTPQPSVAGATLAIPTDSTDRFGTGRSFTSLAGLTGAGSGLRSGAVRADLVADPQRLPLARLQAGAAIGAEVLGGADASGAGAYVDALTGKSAGTAALRDQVTSLMAAIGGQAREAKDALTSATGRRDDAVGRRDGFSGVNLDDELSRMVVLQNSYSAAARLMSAANQMYETLIGMVGS